MPKKQTKRTQKNTPVYATTSTGKEKDAEKGYSYFGARYMDHELMTMWLSVDPLADKYPSISPYAYCVWNPVKLVDPNGREIDPSCIDEWDQCKNEIEKKRTGASIITVPSKHSFSNSKTEVESIILR